MNLLVNAAVAAADGAVYKLATRLFKGRKAHPLAIISTRDPRGAKVIILINLIMISAALIWVKATL